MLHDDRKLSRLEWNAATWAFAPWADAGSLTWLRGDFSSSPPRDADALADGTRLGRTQDGGDVHLEATVARWASVHRGDAAGNTAAGKEPVRWAVIGSASGGREVRDGATGGAAGTRAAPSSGWPRCGFAFSK